MTRKLESWYARPQLAPTSVMGWGISFGQMAEKTATTTPQVLRDQAERTIQLAHGILDKPAKAALLTLAQELQEKAAQLEAAVPTEAPTTTETPLAAIAPTEATETAAATAMQDTTESTDSTKTSDVEDSN